MAELWVLNSAHMVTENKVSGAHHEHRLGFLINHVRIGCHFRDHLCLLDVAIVDRTIPRIVQTGKDLHERVVDKSS